MIQRIELNGWRESILAAKLMVLHLGIFWYLMNINIDGSMVVS